jgi:hypothetical protein
MKPQAYVRIQPGRQAIMTTGKEKLDLLFFSISQKKRSARDLHLLQ